MSKKQHTFVPTTEAEKIMYEALQNIARNAPDDKEPPQDQWKWTMWVAGNVAKMNLLLIDTLQQVRTYTVRAGRDYLEGFHCVISYNGGAEIVKSVHDTYDEARQEAERLNKTE